MQIIIIPGFTGYPEEITFTELTKTLTQLGHSVIKIAWPNIPDNLNKYNFTETLNYSRKIIDNIANKDITILGFSMGGIIATQLATEFNIKKLGLIVSPYQAGSEDDLSGKYKQWKETGYREVRSSKFGDLEIPFSFIEDARKYNALNLIKNVTAEILFVAGNKDNKVPWTVSKKLFSAANEPKTWHLIPGMEHKYQYQPEILKKVDNIIIEFIKS